MSREPTLTADYVLPSNYSKRPADVAAVSAGLSTIDADKKMCDNCSLTSVFNQVAPITSSLYLCAARAIKHSVLQTHGITCVVNATVELPNLPLCGIDYVKVPLEDSPYSNLSAYFDSVADKIEQVKNKGGATLIHCIAGVSRSATLCIAYLMKYQGMSLRRAYGHVKSRRSIVRPNVGFFRQLIDYERKLHGCETVRMVPGTSLFGSGLVPDVYADELCWLSTYQNDFGSRSSGT